MPHRGRSRQLSRKLLMRLAGMDKSAKSRCAVACMRDILTSALRQPEYIFPLLLIIRYLMDSRAKFFISRSSGSRLSGTALVSHAENNPASKRKSLLSLGPNALSAGLEPATWWRMHGWCGGTCTPFPLDLGAPIQSANPVFRPFRERHIYAISKRRNE